MLRQQLLSRQQPHKKKSGAVGCYYDWRFNISLGVCVLTHPAIGGRLAVHATSESKSLLLACVVKKKEQEPVRSFPSGVGRPYELALPGYLPSVTSLPKQRRRAPPRHRPELWTPCMHEKEREKCVCLWVRASSSMEMSLAFLRCCSNRSAGESWGGSLDADDGD